MVFKTPCFKVVRKRTGGSSGSHGRKEICESPCHDMVQNRTSELSTWARRHFFFNRIDSTAKSLNPESELKIDMGSEAVFCLENCG